MQLFFAKTIPSVSTNYKKSLKQKNEVQTRILKNLCKNKGHQLFCKHSRSMTSHKDIVLIGTIEECIIDNYTISLNSHRNY